jgi:hypothetical protein
MVVALALALVTLAAGACTLKQPSAECARSSDCQSGGVCVGANCVYADPGCASGYRFDKNAPASIANTCAQALCGQSASAALCDQGDAGPACVNLMTDNQHCGACGTVCPSGQVCSQGNCQGSCASGLATCGSECVDTATDPANCGGCNKPCMPNQICQSSGCVDICDPGLMRCGSSCIDPSSDPSNCGGCAHPCAAGQACTGGTCGIPSSCPGDAGEAYCAPDGGFGACVNLMTDQANCGACSHACPAGQVCQAGMCGTMCDSARTLCSPDGGIPYCADTNSDPANCGGCGVACPPSQVCLSGVCKCAPNTPALCGTGASAFCTNLAEDPDNCGACSTVCPTGQYCSPTGCTLSCPGTSSPCPATGTATYCADLTSDDLNCGACGKPCAPGDACVAGVCQCPTSLPDACLSGAAAYCTNRQTDSSNCGQCGNACADDATCVAGVCSCSAGTESCGTQTVPLCFNDVACGAAKTNCAATGQICVGTACVPGPSPAVVTSVTSNSMVDVATDGRNLYWADPARGVLQVPVGGGTPQTLSPMPALMVVVDSSYVYFNTQGLGGPPVLRVPIGGGLTTPMCASCAQYADQLAVNDQDVYVTDNQTGEVLAIATQGNPLVTPIDQGTGSPAGIALDSTSVYWVDLAAFTVMKAPLVGMTGTKTTLSMNENSPDRIVVHGPYAYFTTADGLRRVPIDGSSAATTVASMQLQPSGYGELAADNEAVYFHDSGSALYKLPYCSPTPIKLAAGNVYGVAVDESWAYYTSFIAPGIDAILK